MKRAPRPLREYPNLAAWADAVSSFLLDDGKQVRVDPKPVLLARRYNNEVDAKATEDGILLFNAETGNVEYSLDGQWHPLAGKPTDITVAGVAAVGSGGSLAVSFAEPFSVPPAVTVTPLSHIDADTALSASIRNVTAEGFTIDLKKVESTFDTIVKPSAGTVHWLAFGTG